MFDEIRSLASSLIQNWDVVGGPIIAIGVILGTWTAYHILTPLLRTYLRRKVAKPENMENFLLLWRSVWWVLIAIFAIVGFSGSFAALGLSAAFLGIVVGWSLQAPMSGIVAWLMIILKRPFRIGDRIIVENIIGDVMDISLTHIKLNQVGGTIAGEESSGRMVLIPNSILFQKIIHNYTYAGSYILDEVPVMVTFGSDYNTAEKILMDAARQATSEIISQTQQEPFVRAEITESGLRLRLRYKTFATDRQRVSSDIVRKIVEQLSQNDEVEFAYPHSEIIYREKGGPKKSSAVYPPNHSV